MHKILLIIVIFVFSYSAKAHPHVFINSEVGIKFDSQGIVGFNIQWTYDMMFTELMLNEFDSNGDKKFDSKEIKKLYSKAFSNLKKHNYLTHIFIANTELNIKKITLFNAEIKNGQMIYSFFIPVKIVAKNEFQNIKIYCYDESYYMDMIFNEDNPLVLQNADNFITSFSNGEDENMAYYFKQIYPQFISFNFRKK